MSYGKTVMVVSASAGAGGNEHVHLAPAAGQQWEVIEAVGYHDDNAAARDCFWSYDDGSSTVYRSTSSVNQLLRIDAMSTVTGTSVVGNSVKGGPIVLNHGQELTFSVNSLGAGKKAYVNAIVVKRFGVPEWA